MLLPRRRLGIDLRRQIPVTLQEARGERAKLPVAIEAILDGRILQILFRHDLASFRGLAGHEPL